MNHHVFDRLLLLTWCPHVLMTTNMMKKKNKHTHLTIFKYISICTSAYFVQLAARGSNNNVDNNNNNNANNPLCGSISLKYTRHADCVQVVAYNIQHVFVIVYTYVYKYVCLCVECISFSLRSLRMRSRMGTHIFVQHIVICLAAGRVGNVAAVLCAL